MTQIAALPDRTVLEVSGEDRVSFLQGIVSNDVAQAMPGRAVWAALLTPQGKYLADFFILSDGERLLLDTETGLAQMVAQKLARFRLRAKAAIAPRPDLRAFAAWDGPAGGLPDGAILVADPRLPDAGQRILSAGSVATNAGTAEWDTHRIALGLPDGTRDLDPEKTVLLEAGFDELGGISWTKGCYMGQELTARTRYRGLVKRRLVPVEFSGAAPPPGAAIIADGVEVGTMRSSAGSCGLAVLRIEAFDRELECAGATLHARIPDWLRLPEKAAQPA